MNKLDLTRGVGLTRQKFNFFQDGIREGFRALLSAYGLNGDDGVKLQGCELTVTDNSGVLTIVMTEGYIALEGEPYYVPAQTIVKQANEKCYFVVDSQKVDNIPGQIKGGGTYDMQEQRRAKLVVSTSAPVIHMPYNAQSFETAIRNAATDIGEIKFFDPRPQGKVMSDFFDMTTGVGLPEEKYKGWVVLGIHATYKADYAGRVIVALTDTATDSDFDTVGKKGGEKEHLLTVDEMPEHDHGLIEDTSGGGNSDYPTTTGMGSNTLVNADGVTQKTGGDQAHNNMQPYIVAAAIMRVA